MSDDKKLRSSAWRGEGGDILTVYEEQGPWGEIAPTLAIGIDTGDCAALSRQQVKHLRNTLTEWLDTGRLPID